MMVKLRFSVIWCLVLSWLLCGCELVDFFSDDENIQDFIAQVKARPKKKIEVDPVIPDYKPYPYEVTNIRSPFQLFQATVKAEIKSDSKCIPDKTRLKTYMERFDLNSFKLVGYLKVDGVKIALFKIGQMNGVFKVKNNDYIGDNYGKVTITDDKVEVEEKFKDGEDENGEEVYKCRTHKFPFVTK